MRIFDNGITARAFNESELVPLSEMGPDDAPAVRERFTETLRDNGVTSPEFNRNRQRFWRSCKRIGAKTKSR